MNFIIELGNIEFIIDIIKILFINIYTYYMNFKIIGKEINRNVKLLFNILIPIFVITLACKFIKQILGIPYYIVCMCVLLGLFFAKESKNSITYSLLITIVSLSINYVMFIASILFSFIPAILFNIQNMYISLILILIFYSIFLNLFYRIKKFKKGFIFLKKKLKDEYLEILILNISVILLFSIILMSNYKNIRDDGLGFGFIIFAIIMFITIQRSLQLYYKQKLLKQELQETKKELEDKKEEVKQLEKDNLESSKKIHSIIHKQKSLEYKLNELELKTEIAEEIQIKDKIKTISKEIYKEPTIIELTKTGIEEIDDMLKYMQSECVKRKIDFQLQLSGDIQYMVNNYITKENLEILIADHIKNAIIAIDNSNNINKSILVRIGKIEGIYSVYIYDSGIEFQIDTLINLGTKPSTTHADSGGTGMGFMNTFDTLNKSKASISICELGKPCKDNFTKIIKIIFDNKNEYNINSYREQEIKEADKEKRCKISALKH